MIYKFSAVKNIALKVPSFTYTSTGTYDLEYEAQYENNGLSLQRV